jgi:EXS family
MLSLLLFWAITHGSSHAVAAWEILPALYLLLLVLCFALPYIRSRSGRYRFLSTLKRVSLGGLAEAKDGKFGDIILADVLTSYSKVLGDLFICICMFFSKGMSSTGIPNRTIGGSFMTPLIISIPSIIRLRQCLTEFFRVRKQHQASNGWGGQHLGNALKYASAFPVIVLSALQRGYDPAKIHMSEAGLFRLWYEPP